MGREIEKEKETTRESLFYIDSPRLYPQKSKRCKYAHLACFSSLEDLHDFAQNQLDLKRHWFHASPFPHYDVPERKHSLALESGAILVSTRTLVQSFRDSKFSKKFRVLGAATSTESGQAV